MRPGRQERSVHAAVLVLLIASFASMAAGAVSDYAANSTVHVTERPGAPSIPKAQPVYLSCESPSTAFSVACGLIDGPEDIAVFDPEGDVLPYEIERLPRPGREGVVWVSNRWVRDGSAQATLAYGSGPVDRQDIDGAWSSSDQDVRAVYHHAGDGTADNWTRSPANPVTPEEYQDPAIIHEDGTYYLFAAGPRGIAVFSSDDGKEYDLEGPIIQPGIDVQGDVVSDAEILRTPSGARVDYWLFYQVDEREFRVARSDRLTEGWRDTGAILSADDLGVHAITEPSVIHDDGARNGSRRWKMLFTAGPGDSGSGNASRNSQTWYAFSGDGVANWTVHPGNPVLTSSSSSDHVQDPDFYRADGRYYQYVNSGAGDMYKFLSTDPTHWTEEPGGPVLTENSQGTWDDRYVFAPDIMADPERDGHYMVYQGGRIRTDASRGQARFAIGVGRGQVNGTRLVFDSSGNAHHATAATVIRRAEGQFGNGFRFGQHSTVLPRSMNRSSGPFTMMAWVNPVVGERVVRGRLPWRSSLPVLGPIQVMEPWRMADGGWHLVVTTYDGTDLTTWIDGERVGSFLGVEGGTGWGNENNARPGFAGAIDEVRIYEDMKDADWIDAEIDASVAGGRSFFFEGDG